MAKLKETNEDMSRVMGVPIEVEESHGIGTGWEDTKHIKSYDDIAKEEKYLKKVEQGRKNFEAKNNNKGIADDIGDLGRQNELKEKLSSSMDNGNNFLANRKASNPQGNNFLANRKASNPQQNNKKPYDKSEIKSLKAPLEAEYDLTKKSIMTPDEAYENEQTRERERRQKRFIDTSPVVDRAVDNEGKLKKGRDAKLSHGEGTTFKDYHQGKYYNFTSAITNFPQKYKGMFDAKKLFNAKPEEIISTNNEWIDKITDLQKNGEIMPTQATKAIKSLQSITEDIKEYLENKKLPKSEEYSPYKSKVMTKYNLLNSEEGKKQVDDADSNAVVIAARTKALNQEEINKKNKVNTDEDESILDRMTNDLMYSDEEYRNKRNKIQQGIEPLKRYKASKGQNPNREAVIEYAIEQAGNEGPEARKYIYDDLADNFPDYKLTEDDKKIIDYYKNAYDIFYSLLGPYEEKIKNTYSSERYNFDQRAEINSIAWNNLWEYIFEDKFGLGNVSYLSGAFSQAGRPTRQENNGNQLSQMSGYSKEQINDLLEKAAKLRRAESYGLKGINKIIGEHGINPNKKMDKLINEGIKSQKQEDGTYKDVPASPEEIRKAKAKYEDQLAELEATIENVFNTESLDAKIGEDDNGNGKTLSDAITSQDQEAYDDAIGNYDNLWVYSILPYKNKELEKIWSIGVSHGWDSKEMQNEIGLKLNPEIGKTLLEDRILFDETNLNQFVEDADAGMSPEELKDIYGVYSESLEKIARAIKNNPFGNATKVLLEERKKDKNNILWKLQLNELSNVIDTLPNIQNIPYYDIINKYANENKSFERIAQEIAKEYPNGIADKPGEEPYIPKGKDGKRKQIENIIGNVITMLSNKTKRTEKLHDLNSIKY